jgi:hypothetical protein
VECVPESGSSESAGEYRIGDLREDTKLHSGSRDADDDRAIQDADVAG